MNCHKNKNNKKKNAIYIYIYTTSYISLHHSFSFVSNVKPWMFFISSRSTSFTRRCCWMRGFPRNTGETTWILKKLPHPALASVTFTAVGCSLAELRIFASMSDAVSAAAANSAPARRSIVLNICPCSRCVFLSFFLCCFLPLRWNQNMTSKPQEK